MHFVQVYIRRVQQGAQAAAFWQNYVPSTVVNGVREIFTSHWTRHDTQMDQIKYISMACRDQHYLQSLWTGATTVYKLRPTNIDEMENYLHCAAKLNL